MQTSTAGHNEVLVVFEDAEAKEYERVAASQGWDIPDFIAKAVKGYYRLCLDLIDKKEG